MKYKFQIQMHNNNILRGKEILYLFMKMVIFFFLIRFLNWRQCLRHKSTLKSVKSANEKKMTLEKCKHNTRR